MTKNHFNDGRGFEGSVETVLKQYHSKGVMRLQKVDPPNRIISKFGQKIVIHLANPFLDYCGTWTEQGGKALFIEAKSTSDNRLEMGTKSGLTDKQRESMREWRNSGAGTGLLWEMKGNVKFVTIGEIEAVRLDRKSLRFDEHGEDVAPGIGFIYFDFVVNLRRHCL